MISLLLIFSALYRISQSSILNYTLYKGNAEQITIPSNYFESEDPFSASLSTYMIKNDNYNLNLNLSTLEYTELLSSFCSFNNLQTSIYSVKSIQMENTSKNFEFINVQNYIYFYDTNQNLLIYELNKTSDGVLNEIIPVIQYPTKLITDDNSFIRFFSDMSTSSLYLVVNNQLNVYSLNSLAFPIYLITLPFILRNSLSIQVVDYTQGCFVFLMEHKYIELHCTNSVKDGFDVISDYGENAIKTLLSTQNITVTEYNYTDLMIDENDLLIISEYNIGLIVFNISNPKSPNLMGIQQMNGVTMIKKFYQSLMLIKQYWYNSPYPENHFEEYYTRLSTNDNQFDFNLNAEFLLNYSPIKGVHIARQYAVLLQTDSMKIYRHSMNKLLNPTLYPLQGFLSEGIINLHRLRGVSNQNLFIAVFPYKLSIYNIEIMNITLKCQPPLDLKRANYLLNFSIASSHCSEMDSENFINNESSFLACIYSFPAIAMVYEAGATVSEKDKTGLIVGLTVGLFFAVVILVICGFYLFKITRKYDQLEEKRGQTVSLGGKGVIGGYEDSEKISNEPPAENKIEFELQNRN